MQDFRDLDRKNWHQRYVFQAVWTQHVRQYILNKINPPPGARFLEVGSGTSAILEALSKQGNFSLTGIDIDYPSLFFASTRNLPFHLAQADGHHLPFAENTFEVSLCHFFLMWLANPLILLREMYRVAKPGGWVIALAEPDHQARIDFPPPLEELGTYQTQALQDQGVDVCLGRKLRSLFHQSGLQNVEVGIMSAQWDVDVNQLELETEWIMLRSDLQDRLSDSELNYFQHIDQQARQGGKRILYVPTFYGIGKAP